MVRRCRMVGRKPFPYILSIIPGSLARISVREAEQQLAD